MPIALEETTLSMTRHRSPRAKPGEITATKSGQTSSFAFFPFLMKSRGCGCEPLSLSRLLSEDQTLRARKSCSAPSETSDGGARTLVVTAVTTRTNVED